jgi:hypothetical protein
MAVCPPFTGYVAKCPDFPVESKKIFKTCIFSLFKGSDAGLFACFEIFLRRDRKNYRFGYIAIGRDGKALHKYTKGVSDDG